MKEFLKDYFYYTRAERNGIIVLSILSVFFLGIRFTMDYWYKPQSTDYTELLKKIIAQDSIKLQAQPQVSLFQFNPNIATLEDLMALGLKEKLAQTVLNYRSKGGKFKSEKDFQKMWGLSVTDFERLQPYLVFGSAEDAKPNAGFVKVAPKLTNFNPQTASKEAFEALGLSGFLADRIINYRTKGGKFKKKEDFQKMYGLKPEQYQQLEPYIIIEAVAATTPSTNYAYNNLPTNIPTTYNNLPRSERKPINIDVNRATQEDWQKLRGIGTGFATRILKYRDNLGGFNSIEQVKEVFGLPDSTYQSIKSCLQLSPIYKKLHINNLSIAEFRHPYVKFQDAKIIINYREQHGAFKSVDDLKKIVGVDPSTVEKLRPYLTFD
jgi:competence ComEA-like helix-hairpin-helix protein